MLHNVCEFATDYKEQLRALKDPLKLRESDRIIQFPFTIPESNEKKEEELAKLSERRKEQGKKLQQIAAQKRVEKVTNIPSGS